MSTKTTIGQRADKIDLRIKSLDELAQALTTLSKTQLKKLESIIEKLDLQDLLHREKAAKKEYAAGESPTMQELQDEFSLT